ncbi:MAG: sulfotransferase domain-containing protein [Acidobacteriia bacterium]|nr:sulfotransferase domain-containing protein [Terriglobia bacterium]
MSQQSNNPARPKGGIYSKPRRKPTSLYRKLRRKFSTTLLRKPVLWLRHHGFRPEDVFLGSYPRSGTTWSRFVLYEILTGQEGGFDDVNGLLHGVGTQATGARILPGGGRLIATHERYWKGYHKAIYLVRDARDVILSEFAYTAALEYFQGDLDEFIETFLCEKINAFGPWQNHVTSWLDSPIAGNGNLLVVRFEDLRQNPFQGFTDIAKFLGVNCDPHLINNAIAHNALDKMKEKEDVAPQRASVKGRFVRSGAVQGWRAKLTAEQVRFIEQHAGSVLQRMGYPLSSQLAEPEPLLQTSSGGR